MSFPNYENLRAFTAFSQSFSQINQLVDGQTLFHKAIVEKTGTCFIRLIRELGGNINQENSNGETPLEFAFRENNFNMVMTLLKYNASIRICPNNMFVKICQDRKVEFFKLFVDHCTYLADLIDADPNGLEIVLNYVGDNEFPHKRFYEFINNIDAQRINEFGASTKFLLVCNFMTDTRKEILLRTLGVSPDPSMFFTQRWYIESDMWNDIDNDDIDNDVIHCARIKLILKNKLPLCSVRDNTNQTVFEFAMKYDLKKAIDLCLKNGYVHNPYLSFDVIGNTYTTLEEMKVIITNIPIDASINVVYDCFVKMTKWYFRSDRGYKISDVALLLLQQGHDVNIRKNGGANIFSTLIEHVCRSDAYTDNSHVFGMITHLIKFKVDMTIPYSHTTPINRLFHFLLKHRCNLSGDEYSKLFENMLTHMPPSVMETDYYILNMTGKLYWSVNKTIVATSRPGLVQSISSDLNHNDDECDENYSYHDDDNYEYCGNNQQQKQNKQENEVLSDTSFGYKRMIENRVILYGTKSDMYTYKHQYGFFDGLDIEDGDNIVHVLVKMSDNVKTLIDYLATFKSVFVPCSSGNCYYYDPNNQHNTAIELAILSNKLDIAEFLIDTRSRNVPHAHYDLKYFATSARKIGNSDFAKLIDQKMIEYKKSHNV